MKKSFFVIATLICLIAVASCKASRSYTVDGVIEDLNTCTNSEDLKEMFNDPDFFKWLVDLPQSDQEKIEKRMEYNFVRLRLGVDGIIKEANAATSLYDLHYIIEDYNDIWVRYQPEEDQKRLADAFFNKAIKLPIDPYDYSYLQPIIIERLQYCTTREEVDNLMSDPDLNNLVSQISKNYLSEFLEPIFKEIHTLRIDKNY